MELTTTVAGRHLIITSEFEASDIVHNLVAQFVPNMERCGGQLFSGPVAIRATSSQVGKRQISTTKYILLYEAIR